MNRPGSYASDRGGATAVEFALIAGAFLTIVFGIFDLGRLLLAWNTFQYAVENATRHALVTEGVTEAEIQEFVANELTGMTVDADNAAVDVQFYTVSGVNFIEVDGTYEFDTWLPLLPDSMNMTLTANSRLPIP